MEARFLKDKLGDLLGGDVYLDSDDLHSESVVVRDASNLNLAV